MIHACFPFLLLHRSQPGSKELQCICPPQPFASVSNPSSALTFTSTAGPTYRCRTAGAETAVCFATRLSQMVPLGPTLFRHLHWRVCSARCDNICSIGCCDLGVPCILSCFALARFQTWQIVAGASIPFSRGSVLDKKTSLERARTDRIAWSVSKSHALAVIYDEGMFG